MKFSAKIFKEENDSCFLETSGLGLYLAPISL
jgi:hypothetical protein